MNAEPKYLDSGSVLVQPEGVDSLSKHLSSGLHESGSTNYIEPAVLDELERQQNQRFFDFRQFRVPSKVQTAFASGVKVYKRNLPSVPINYRQLQGHPL